MKKYDIFPRVLLRLFSGQKTLYNTAAYVIKIIYCTLHSDETATIRVTNLSEDTKESDLMDLFRPFGPIAKIFLAKDKNTNQSRVVAPKIICLQSVCSKGLTLWERMNLSRLYII